MRKPSCGSDERRPGADENPLDLCAPLRRSAGHHVETSCGVGFDVDWFAEPHRHVALDVLPRALRNQRIADSADDLGLIRGCHAHTETAQCNAHFQADRTQADQSDRGGQRVEVEQRIGGQDTRAEGLPLIRNGRSGAGGDDDCSRTDHPIADLDVIGAYHVRFAANQPLAREFKRFFCHALRGPVAGRAGEAP